MKIKRIAPAEHAKTAEFTSFVCGAASGLADGSFEESLLTEVRNSRDLHVPALDLQLVDQNQVVGTVCLANYTPDVTPKAKMLYLATLCVLPSRQGAGLGTKLLNFALDRAKRLGYSGVVVEGDPAYFSRFGFVPSTDHDMPAKPGFEPLEDAYLMVHELSKGALSESRGELSFDQFETIAQD